MPTENPTGPPPYNQSIDSNITSVTTGGHTHAIPDPSYQWNQQGRSISTPWPSGNPYAVPVTTGGSSTVGTGAVTGTVYVTDPDFENLKAMVVSLVDDFTRQMKEMKEWMVAFQLEIEYLKDDLRSIMDEAAEKIEAP